MSRPLLSRCTCLIAHPSPSQARPSSSSAPRPPPRPPIATIPSRSDYPQDRPWRATSRSHPPSHPSAHSSSHASHTHPSSAPRPSGSALPIQPRIGRAQEVYLALQPEEQRREDVARLRLLKELTPQKLYAQEREKERIRSAKPGGRAGDGERLVKASRNVVPPQERGWHAPGRENGGRDGLGGRREQSQGGGREQGQRGGRGVYGAAGGVERPMVPGRVNRGTRAVGVDRSIVQPIVRGGAVKSTRNARNKSKPMRKVVLPSTLRLENLTNLLGVKLWRLQKAMERIGLENTRPERLLTAEDASLVALELNFDPTIDDEAAFDIYPSPPSTDLDLPLRPPVTGIFGHVDHGKTSLLDRLRSTSVAAGEAGGITQHIGAFEVSVSSIVANLRGTNEPLEEQGTITFLDTPGHAAFTAMRERGAGVTDVVVLVVAADDGVKPQTEEVIGLIKSADVGVVVAITKCDKPGVDTTKVKQGLMAAGVEIESFGGDVPCVEVSSVTGQGFPELLETISAIAEVRELKAERVGRVEGRVLESRVEKGRGNVATVLVLRGCLRPTASLVAGTTWCRVRSLVPPTGKAITSAFPGQPVEVTGWKELPSAGDLVLEAGSEDEAKKAIGNRLKRIEQEKLWADVEVINEKRRVEAEIESVRREEEANAKASGLKGKAVTAAGDLAVEEMGKKAVVKELVLIIKADVSGTVEAVVGALQGIGNAEARVKIVYSGVGDVQESDVEMARAVEGCVVGFNVKAPNAVLKAALRPPYAVPIHTSPIIYRLVDTIRAAVADLLPKTTETRVHGEALVQQVFEIAIKGRKEPKKVAGCKVGNGVFQKARKARIVRRGETIHTGTVDTLKQVKKDVLEIAKGVECGIALDDFDDFQPDDIVQSIEEVEVSRTL